MTTQISSPYSNSAIRGCPEGCGFMYVSLLSTWNYMYVCVLKHHPIMRLTPTLTYSDYSRRNRTRPCRKFLLSCKIAQLAVGLKRLRLCTLQAASDSWDWDDEGWTLTRLRNCVSNLFPEYSVRHVLASGNLSRAEHPGVHC